MEDARKSATPAVLKATLTSFKNEMLTEHTWPQAQGQLKDEWRAYIQKNFVQAGGSGGPVGPSCNPSKLPTPPGSPPPPSGAGGGG